VKNWLTTSRTMDARSAANPGWETRLAPNRRARPPLSSEARTAVRTCGRNIVPYWVLDRAYSPGSVTIVLAAGKVISTTPWTSPAA
jgi:hypothetical protein